MANRQPEEFQAFEAGQREATPARLVRVYLRHEGQRKFEKQQELSQLLAAQGIHPTGIHPAIAGFFFVLREGAQTPLDPHMDPQMLMDSVPIDTSAKDIRQDGEADKATGDLNRSPG